VSSEESAVRLERARRLGSQESGLAVVVTSRPDGSAQASVVNAGVLEHPVTCELIVGFIARGGARKLVNLRLRPRLTVVFRSGWEWVAVEGVAELAGPDDQCEGLDSKDLPRLLRTVYAAAVGGNQDDWAELDDVMAAEGHAAVLVRPLRIYSNPGQ
jgi:Pyridoxamine 5'-phosphate oxidase